MGSVDELKAAKADLSVIELTDIATDDVWCRDHGPIFVKNDRTKELALTDWEFHGWGGKFEASLDNQVPGKIAAKLGVQKFSYPFELEGGGIEVSGDGLLLTTEAVQNNPNRAEGRDDAAFASLAALLVERSGRLIENRMPTGLAVTAPMQHGGPWPSAAGLRRRPAALGLSHPGAG